MEELEITGADSPEQDPQNGSAPAEPGPAQPQVVVMGAVPADELLALEDACGDSTPSAAAVEDARLKAVMEALVYVAEDPITVAQVAVSLEQPAERIRLLLGELIAEYEQPGRGIQIREVAGGYRMATKPEHHDAVRAFVRSLKPPLKLSLPALETLAVIAYKQPVTAPEVKEIRGVQGTGVLSTLLDRKLIAEAGRKNVIGKPILYKTTKEFLIQFGLKDLSELPTLKEFEEIRRMAMADGEPGEQPQAEPPASEASQSAPEAGAAEPAPADAEAPAAEAAGPGPADAEAPAAEAAGPAPVDVEAPADGAAEPVPVDAEAPAAEAAEPAPADAEAPAAEAAEPAPVDVEAPADGAAEPVPVDAEAPAAEAAEPAPADAEAPAAEAAGPAPVDVEAPADGAAEPVPVDVEAPAAEAAESAPTAAEAPADGTAQPAPADAEAPAAEAAEPAPVEAGTRAGGEEPAPAPLEPEG